MDPPTLTVKAEDMERGRRKRHRKSHRKRWYYRSLVHPNFQNWQLGSKRDEKEGQYSPLHEAILTLSPESIYYSLLEQMMDLSIMVRQSYLYLLGDDKKYLQAPPGDPTPVVNKQRHSGVGNTFRQSQFTHEPSPQQNLLYSRPPAGFPPSVTSPLPPYPYVVNTASGLEMSTAGHQHNRTMTPETFSTMARQAARRNASNNYPYSMNGNKSFPSPFSSPVSSGIDSPLSAPSNNSPMYNTNTPLYVVDSPHPTRMTGPNHGSSRPNYATTSLSSRSNSPGSQYGTILPSNSETPYSPAAASIPGPQYGGIPSRYTNSTIGIGLDSGMPSQLPRQGHVSTLRPVNPRVRAMQNALAADPKVRVAASRASQSNTPRMAPHLARSSTPRTFPSVLNPFVRAPLMSYQQALADIIHQTGPLIMSLKHLKPCAVSVVLYDIVGRPITVSEGLILSKNADVKYTVNFIQSLLDEHQSKNERLIIKTIEIRIGTKELSLGYPALEGKGMHNIHVDWAKWVRWDTKGEMEEYWVGYRNMLQLTASSAEKPIFKVRTIRQLSIQDGDDFSYGHEFVDVSGLPGVTTQGGDHSGGETQGTMAQYDGGASDSGADQAAGSSLRGMASAPTSTLRPTANPFHSDQNQRAGDSITEEGDLGSSGNKVDLSSKDGSGARMTSKAKAPSVDPTRSWAYFQRMGGDPRNWELYDLSHAPFEAKDFPRPKAESSTTPFNTPDTFVTNIDLDKEPAPVEEHERSDLNAGKAKGKDGGSAGSITPKASKGPAIDPSKAERIARYETEKEAALGFADEHGYIFIPTLNRKIIDPVKTSLPSSQKKKVFGTLGDSLQKEVAVAAGSEHYFKTNPASKFNPMTSLTSPRDGPSGGIDYPGVISSTMNVHAPSFSNFQPGTQSDATLSPYLQSLSFTTSSPYSYSNTPAPARVGTPMCFSSPPKLSPPKTSFGHNRHFVPGRGMTSSSFSPPKASFNTNQAFATGSRFNSPTKTGTNPPVFDHDFSKYHYGSQAAGSSPQLFHSPTKTGTNPPVFDHGFSKYHYGSQAAGSSPQLFHSPTKAVTNSPGFGPSFPNYQHGGQVAGPSPQRFPSPTKIGTYPPSFPPGFDPSFSNNQYGSQAAGSSPPRYPSPTRSSPPKNFGSNQGFNSGYQYGGDGSQFNFNFEYNGGQGSGYQGGM